MFRSKGWIVAFLGVLTLVVCIGALLSVGIYVSLFLDREVRPNEPLPDHVDTTSINGLATYATEYAHRWQGDLFLESYSVTYRVTDQDPKSWHLTERVNFRFAGWRNDWLGNLAEMLDVAHLLASVKIDLEERKIVHFSHSQGSPFGYDAPLNTDSWMLNDLDLIAVCDDQGGRSFRDGHDTRVANIGASSRRVGREWNLTYVAETQYFDCLINIDTGDVETRWNGGPWEEAGNLYSSE